MADLKTTNIFGDAYINNKVGIATNAPATRLQIGQLSPTATTEGIQFGDDPGTRIYRSSAGTLTLSGSVAGLTLSASTALYGNYGDWSGESNKIQWHSNNLYFVNRGGGSWIFRNSSAANVVDIASNGTTTVAGNISAANLSGTNTGDQTIGNGTITIAAGTGIGVGTSNTFTMNQSGATTVTVTNNGVTSNVAGTGISVSGATGAVTITNSSPNATHTGDVTGATALTIANDAVTTVKILNANVTNAKLANSSLTIGSTAISLGATATTIAGLTSVTSTTFVGALTGNATTATALTSMNISQFTNNSGYLTSAVTSLAGTTNRITVSGATGAVTLNLPQDIHTGASPTFAGLSLTSVSTTGATITNLTGAYQNTTVYDSPRTQSATPSRGIRSPASSIQFTDSYAIAPFYTYRSTGDWPVPYGIGWGTGGESSGIFQRYASNGSSFGDMIFYTGNDGSGAFSFRRHTWEGTTYFAAGSGELNTELFRIDWAGKATAISFGLTGGFVLDANGAYGRFNNWVQLNGFFGLYSNNNSAHIYPNNASYGSWRMDGTRNGWGGIEFGNNGVSLMMGSDTIGFHQNTNGWLFRVHQGVGYIYKGSWGGGTAAVILDSSNAPYANNMNQYVRTTDSPTFSTVTAALSGNATTATTLQTARAINGVSFNGSAAITVNGLNYNVNNDWLRENGDDDQFKLYGNSRTMIYRTDGNTNAHGGGAYAHIFYYGGSADANRMFIINTDGRLWSNYHGWLDAMSISGNAATATSADNIDGRPFVNTNSNSATNADTINSNGISYYTSGVTNFSGNATDGALFSQAYSNDWQHQIAGDYRSGQIALRGKNNGTWQSWRRVLDETNSPYALNMNQYVRTTDNPTFGTVTAALSGNATTATTLQTARNINGTSFNGSAAITTATWGTARTLTIGSTGKSVDGSAAITWSLAEIGAAATNQTMFIGTTSVAINRASTSQTLTGVSIAGNAATVTNGVYTNVNNTLTGINTQYNETNTFINTVTSGNRGLSIQQSTAGADAYMTFHISSDYAAYFGLGGVENDLVYGGWSAGNNRHRILHSGNAAYAWNMNQYVRTTDSPTFSTVTATLNGNAGSVTYSPNRTDSTAYPVLWGAAYTNAVGTIAYSCAAVTIQSSTGTLTATSFSGAGTGLTGTAASLSIGGSAASLISANSYTVGNLTVNGMAQLVGVKETYVNVNIASGVVTIDLNAGTVFRLNYNATVNSFTINNRTNNKVNSFTLISVAAAGAGGINFTFTSNTLKWAGSTAPTATVTADKFDVFSFIFDGTNWYGFVGGLNY
jgi:hypothetical protein